MLLYHLRDHLIHALVGLFGTSYQCWCGSIIKWRHHCTSVFASVMLCHNRPLPGLPDGTLYLPWITIEPITTQNQLCSSGAQQQWRDPVTLWRNFTSLANSVWVGHYGIVLITEISLAYFNDFLWSQTHIISMKDSSEVPLFVKQNTTIWLLTYKV